ncbi:hypothetical protein [Streptococcus iners]|uniref:Uncharacterized protein n=1 Tax=Streptococcus iners TaxID=3028084 RepID=A0AA96VMA7_9STRE|nr:hypothetical protein [Streptococcus sp. 29887]MCK4025907.1 hypothetical protein [Streptococcus suis]WNY51642.1 hypothetical protein PW252_03065 [Streptococcus sp. 29887]
MGVMEKANFIRNSVLRKDISEKTVTELKSLLFDNQKVPVTHAPISALAIAALDVLGIDGFKGNDIDVEYYIELFKNISYNLST